MNYNVYAHDFFSTFWPLFAGLTSFFVFLILLDLVLKALALWKAARADQPFWFITLLIFNTVGILPIIYLLFFAREHKVQLTSPIAANKTASKTKKRK